MGVVVIVLTIRLVVVMIVVLVVRHKKMQNSKEDTYVRVLHHFEPGGDNNFHKTINSGVGNTSEDDDGSIMEDNRGPSIQHVSTGTHTTTQPGGKTTGSLSTGYDDSFIDSQQYDAIVVHTTTQPGGKATGVGTISAEYDVVDSKTYPQQYDVVLTHTITQPGGKTDSLIPISAGYEHSTTATITEQRTKTSYIGQVVYTIPDKSKKKNKKGKKPVMKKKI